MRELSLHILDIVQNSIRASATKIQVRLLISTVEDLLTIEIEDNGCGMSREMLEKVIDPFVTTRTTRRVGLGIPLFKAAAEHCDGSFTIESEEGQGTLVRAIFCLTHIDRAPLGDIISTVTTVVQGSPELDFIYLHRYDDLEYELSTSALKQELEGVPVNHPLVLEYIANDMRDALVDMLTGV